MQHITDDPGIIEARNREITDKISKRIMGIESQLIVPEEDLELFFRMARTKSVLDIGCGTGRFVNRFFEERFEYIGIDLSPKIIDIARNRNPGANFRVMSFRQLDFPDNSVGNIWSCCCFQYEPKSNILAALKETHRVLSPNGMCLLMIPAASSSSEGVGFEGLYLSKYLYAEFLAQIMAAGFMVIQSEERYYDGTYSYLLRK